LVLYGDSYLPIDFASVRAGVFPEQRYKPALMTVQRNATNGQEQCPFVDNVIVEYNKRAPTPSMRHIDYGLGAISAQVLADEKHDGAVDLADVYHRVVAVGTTRRVMKFTSGLRNRSLKGSPKRRTISGRGLMGYAEQHMRESAEIIGKMDLAPIEKDGGSACDGKADGDESSSSASAGVPATAPMP